MTTTPTFLRPKRLAEFLMVAGHAGQTEVLDRPVVSHFRIDNMADARRVLSRATPDERRRRGATFLDGLEYRSRLPQGMHDRGEAHVYADGLEDTERDSRGHRNHFPIYVRTYSVVEHVVAAGDVWDVTVGPEEWGVDEREEFYNIVNVGRLVLGDGASVVVQGNAWTLICQELTCGAPAAADYHIGVLGTRHGFGGRRGARDGGDGAPGAGGPPGRHGLPPRYGSSLLGRVATAPVDPAALDGTAGGVGEPGTNGEAGLNGGACRIAEITVRALRTEHGMVVGAIAGDGGDGGNGGAGGPGGAGGDGVAAIRTVDGPVGPGAGGRGGDGGDGGRGGRAGHSGIASNVFVTVPDDCTSQVRLFARAGRSGTPGRGGPGGRPGPDGLSGAAGPGSPAGRAGSAGNDGRAGRVMPAAKMYLNSEWLASDA